jgi:hypothetical protein
VLETVSTTDTAAEVRDKVDDWLAFGCRTVWVQYARRRLDQFSIDGAVRSFGPNDEVAGGDVLPGLRFRLGEL